MAKQRTKHGVELQRFREVLEDVSEWPEINLWHLGLPESEYDDYAIANALGTSPSLYEKLPARVASIVGELCSGKELDRSMVYGYLRDGEFHRVADRREPVGELTNILALLDIFPDNSESGEFSHFHDVVTELQESVELKIVGPHGMRKHLDYFLNAQNPWTDDVEGVVPFYMRLSTREKGSAPEETGGARVSEVHLMHFLTLLYGEAAMLTLDRTVDSLLDARSELTWNWLVPPREHLHGPVVQKGNYNVRTNTFVRDRMGFYYYKGEVYQLKLQGADGSGSP